MGGPASLVERSPPAAATLARDGGRRRRGAGASASASAELAFGVAQALSPLPAEGAAGALIGDDRSAGGAGQRRGSERYFCEELDFETVKLWLTRGAA
jgi:hypothetical protein